MKKITAISNIPLHYARLTNHPYGTEGIPYEFEIETAFFNTITNAFEEVFNECPLGIPRIITSAGVFVNKPGQHGHGRAFDLDAIFWDNHSLVTLNFIHQKELYLGIESFLRKHFGIVLNHNYPNHEDHWHLDNSVPVDFDTNATSEVLYVQMVLRYIYGEEVLIDGLWGRQTNGIIKEVFARLNIPTPITTKANYLKFLDYTGKIAFRLGEQVNTPQQLLVNLSEVLENLPLQYRNATQEALNTFLQHDESSNWLSGFNRAFSVDDIITDIIT